MKFLTLLSFVMLFLASCVSADSEIITAVRPIIMEAYLCERVGTAPDGTIKRITKEVFTSITLDYIKRVKPDSNVIVVHGRHQVTNIEGEVERYDETIGPPGKEVGFTVYMLSKATFALQDEGGSENLRINGTCEERGPKSKVWDCK
ncbi:hypothetical protein BD779DRAFT_1685085 [Infundibulicybe gibba]|nr:hypothetical protein BD779DRAFT_1685085 [Infundibulicybe gibba]